MMEWFRSIWFTEEQNKFHNAVKYWCASGCIGFDPYKMRQE